MPLSIAFTQDGLGPIKSLPQHTPLAGATELNTPQKKHRIGLPLEGPLQSHLRNYLGSMGSLLAHLQKQAMHVLALGTQRQDSPPGHPGNAAPGVTKVLVGRKSCRQEKTTADPICREGIREAALFKNRLQV